MGFLQTNQTKQKNTITPRADSQSSLPACSLKIVSGQSFKLKLQIGLLSRIFFILKQSGVINHLEKTSPQDLEKDILVTIHFLQISKFYFGFDVF